MDPRSFVETDELTAQVLAGKTLKSQILEDEVNSEKIFGKFVLSSQSTSLEMSLKLLVIDP